VKRNFYATSSCGVCGKASIAQVRLATRREVVDFELAGDLLHSLPASLRQAQDQFQRTGALHAAGLFDAGGSLLTVREDVGRHNAVDKLVGHFTASGAWPPPASVLMVSGRTSFEIVQKARLSGIGFIASVSGPSSLAVDLAQEADVTLVGFVRDRGFNVYTHQRRLRL
jgi:FdhD protein